MNSEVSALVHQNSGVYVWCEYNTLGGTCFILALSVAHLKKVRSRKMCLKLCMF